MRSYLICCALACLGSLAALALGALEPLERPLLDLRMRLVERAADPGPVLIEIDPRSIHEVGRWPWPRSLHALLLDRLTAAEAGEVFLDVDFSLRSEESEDAALEGALARRQGRTTLAAFRQWSASAGAYVDAAPQPRFARHARLASANMVPAADGMIRQAQARYPWQDRELPSFAAALAGYTGGGGSFYIDYGIRVENLTRLSFVDVARGLVDPDILRGRSVIVGATAVELADILAVPNHRVLPGVVVQMLAAQSLLLDRALQRLPFWAFLLALPAFIAALACLGRRASVGGLLGAFVGGNVLLTAGALGLQAAAPLLLDIVPFIVGSLLMVAAIFLQRFQRIAHNLVTETLSRRRTERLMGTVAQSAFDALVTTDATGRIHFMNPAASRMFGVPFAEAAGISAARFIARPEMVGEEKLVGTFERIVAAGRTRRLVCRRANGEQFHADLAVSELLDAGHRMFILLVRDIDRRVKAERRLLARERELRRAKTEAELANAAKTEFLHNMSHELKTPLNAIIGFSEMMEKQLLGPLGSDGYVTYAKDIRESGERLLHTVVDVLEFSRIESGDCEMTDAEFDLVGLCHKAAERLQEVGRATGHEIEAYAPPADALYRGDERLIKLALEHVLANAVKFTPSGGKIVFMLHLDDDGCARIVVEDTGIGIDPAEIESCFEAFSQADRGLGRSHEGSGLGLTLAKRFIELHQGSIFLRSKRADPAAAVPPGSGTPANSGTRVTIMLPAARRCTAVKRRSA